MNNAVAMDATGVIPSKLVIAGLQCYCHIRIEPMSGLAMNSFSLHTSFAMFNQN